MDLLCAEGLPGTDDLKIEESLTTLDQWAQHAKSETERNFHHFRSDPAEFENSEGYFRMLILATVVYEDFGIRYNPRWIAPPQPMIENDHFFADAQDVFVHGVIGPRRMGTCSSMPVFYVALGRRLGYPLKLVSTKGHLFVRWDTPSDRFDVDATGKGMNRYTHERYKQWPFPVTDEEIKANGYFKSMTPAEELSAFLSIRAMCLSEAGKKPETIAAASAACRFAPDWHQNHEILAWAQIQYVGVSMDAILNEKPTFTDHLEEIDYYVWSAQTISILKRADQGIPERPLPIVMPGSNSENEMKIPRPTP